jgi:hypothetical protein
MCRVEAELLPARELKTWLTKTMGVISLLYCNKEIREWSRPLASIFSFPLPILGHGLILGEAVCEDCSPRTLSPEMDVTGVLG